jgi:hypothetical protein
MRRFSKGNTDHGAPPAQAPLLAYRWPGQDPEVWNVAPLQPQYSRRSFVQARSFGMHVPGSAWVQPCPSQTPELQLMLSKHGWPSASSVAPAGAGTVGSEAGGGASAGVAGSVAGGGLVGDGGGELALPGQPAIQPTSRAAVSNSLTRMGASYTLRDG